MRRHLGHISSLAVLLLAAAVGGAGMAGLGSTTKAMACCAKTHHQCAGVKSADECCRHMGHTAGDSPAATLKNMASAAPAADMPAVLPATPRTPTVEAPLPIRADFKRPHDPPHLHGFPLLI